MIRSRCIALLATGALFVGMLVTATAPPSFAVLKKTTPAPRYGATMAYDAAAGEVVLFGGQGVYDTHVGRQTWTWDGSTWTQRQPLHSPPARLDAGMVYDALDGQVVLFGGVGPASTRGDTWTWNGTDWTEQHPAHA